MHGVCEVLERRERRCGFRAIGVNRGYSPRVMRSSALRTSLKSAKRTVAHTSRSSQHIVNSARTPLWFLDFRISLTCSSVASSALPSSPARQVEYVDGSRLAYRFQLHSSRLSRIDFSFCARIAYSEVRGGFVVRELESPMKQKAQQSMRLCCA
jgi:hypothetical protein